MIYAIYIVIYIYIYTHYYALIFGIIWLFLHYKNPRYNQRTMKPHGGGPPPDFTNDDCSDAGTISWDV